MTEIVAEFILQYWLEVAFGIVTAAGAGCIKIILKRLKELKKENKAVADGMQALLRESIVGNYNKYNDRGFCPIYAKESIKKVYGPYHELGGNDVATELYHKILAMPEEESVKHENLCT